MIKISYIFCLCHTFSVCSHVNLCFSIVACATCILSACPQIETWLLRRQFISWISMGIIYFVCSQMTRRCRCPTMERSSSLPMEVKYNTISILRGISLTRHGKCVERFTRWKFHHEIFSYCVYTSFISFGETMWTKNAKYSLLVLGAVS